MILKHFNEGDLVKYSRVEYFATEGDDIESHIDEKIGMFIDFWNGDQFDACRIYIFSDRRISTVSSHDLSLLSKNEK